MVGDIKQKFWQGVYFGGLAQSANISFAINLHIVMSSLLQNHSLMCTNPAARCASLIVGMEFTIESCIREHHFSKEFCAPEVGEELPCLSTRGRRFKGHVKTVKADAAKTVQIKCNNNLSSFQLHFIITFVLTEPK